MLISLKYRRYKAELCFLILIALTCGGSARAEEHKVGMKNWEFNPQVLTIREGDTVVWINDDSTHHRIIFEDDSIKGSENIKPERQFSLTFERAGEYKYYCKYHVDNGMKGVVIVKEAAR